jgi:hypothetical protein
MRGRTLKINWGFDLDPPLLTFNKDDLNGFGYEALKHRCNELGMRGFVVLSHWPDKILAVYRRW